MTNEEKAKAAELERQDYAQRFDALIAEATKLSTMEEFYFKPTVEMQRKMQLLDTMLSNERVPKAMAQIQATGGNVAMNPPSLMNPPQS